MADNSDPYPTLESVYRVKGSKVSQLNQKVANIKLNPEQTGDSKVNSRQGQNIPGGSAPRLPRDSISSAGGQPKLNYELADGTDPFPMSGSNFRKKGSKFKQLRQNVGKIKLNPKQSGDSMVNSWQSQNIPGSSDLPSASHDSRSKACGHPNAIHKLAKRGKGKSGEAAGNRWQVKNSNPKSPSYSGKGALNGSNLSSQPVILTTPKNRSSPSVRIDTEPSKNSKDEKIPGPYYTVDYETSEDEMVDSGPDILFDSDNDISLDDSDLVDIKKSHESRKKIKWFRAFFKDLDRLSNEEINTCKWHCPACQGGAGAINWYKGKQPLMNHARTITSRRARLHRLFAAILEEELCRRGASITVAGGTYGKWKGLHKQLDDFDIVWPPMVLIMNTRYAQDEKKKWIGMGNQELLDCFSSYAALKAQHSYGSQGHQGMSVLIFDRSPLGYFNAVRLHDHFIVHKRDRKAWNHHRTALVEGGKRLLFGFLASEKDMDFFNRHSTGNLGLKFEMRSYKETVYSKMNHNSKVQLDYFSNQIAKEQIKSRALEESLLNVGEKLRWTIEESDIVQQLSKVQSCGDSIKKQELKHRLREKEAWQLERERETRLSKLGKTKN